MAEAVAGSGDVLESGFSRRDVVRLITQSLHDLGYHRSAGVLEEESAIRLLSSAVCAFREAVLAGDWDAAAEQVPALGLESAEAVGAVHFLIYEQQFLELVDDQKLDAALECLRAHLAPLQPHSGRTQRLASLLMCGRSEDLRQRCGWDLGPSTADVRTAARQHLLQALQALIPPAVFVPERRLETLLLQAVAQQAGGQAPRSLLRGPSPVPAAQRPRWNLFEDHAPWGTQQPAETFAVLDGHADEVWFVAFSHCGTLLVSTSKDGRAIVWNVARHVEAAGSSAARRARSGSSGSRTSALPAPSGNGACASAGVGAGGGGGGAGQSNGTNGGGDGHPKDAVHVLSGHTDAVTFAAWAPDDKHVLTCSHDRTLKLWSADSGVCERTFRRHEEAVTSCAWLPDCGHFVSGGLDKHILLWSAAGLLLQSWRGLRVHDLALSPKGNFLVVICAEKRIRLYRFQQANGSPPRLSAAEEKSLPETESVTSATVSRCSRYLLASTASQELHLWDLADQALVHRFRGQRQARFVIRCAFGGGDDSYVVSGSEDSQVYIWSRADGALMDVLAGHSGPVNAVAWNPVYADMLVSASDDHTLRLWGPKKGQPAQTRPQQSHAHGQMASDMNVDRIGMHLS